ncbi:hypothetical protein GPECTOR_3g290 [Gonium pectorale]|uniref:Sulfotransferase n=1 Tax=Gonium pectorale TaxID=33097 RepID=A0A150H0Q1_GONPE|nr:hypothetical protein GPECTOR_3g290 [Gonium pectorale]|eukprot:KXZ55140.1 hypothetical protein GPECTOR_3g290 [Gonium pectorale]
MALAGVILVLACSLAPLAAGDATSDFYANLVAQPSALARNVEKKGMVPVERWDDKLFSFEPFHQWIMNSSIHLQRVHRNYPMSFPCGVWVNHYYKFIFIRNRKAASTTVTDNFDKCHYKNANPKLCLEVASLERLKERDIDPATMWKDYFVFTTSRNPCQPSFSSFARDPSILGKISNLFHCFDKVGMYHDYYHTEPVAPCISTAEGLPAVDYIIRYENLTHDLPEAVKLINERRDPSLPPIPEPKIYWKKKGQAARSHEEEGIESSTAALVGHGDKYHKCGMQCVRDIYEYFR